jgi:hypothetical protein
MRRVIARIIEHVTFQLTNLVSSMCGANAFSRKVSWSAQESFWERRETFV